MKAKVYVSFMAMALSLTSASVVFGQEVSDEFKASIGKRRDSSSSSSSNPSTSAPKKNAKANPPKKIEEEKSINMNQGYFGGASIKEESDSKPYLQALLGVRSTGVSPLSEKGLFKTYVDHSADAAFRFGRGTQLGLDGNVGVDIGLGGFLKNQDYGGFLGIRPGVELNTITQFITTPVETKMVKVTDPLRGEIEVAQTSGGELSTRGSAVGAITVGPRVMLMEKNDLNVVLGADYVNVFGASDEARLGEGTQYSVAILSPSVQASVGYKELNLNNGKTGKELNIVANAKIWENKVGTGVALGGFHKEYSVDGTTVTKKTGLNVGVTF